VDRPAVRLQAVAARAARAGPVGLGRAAVRRARPATAGRLREWRLKARPPVVGRDELLAALDGACAERVLTELAAAALPSVARFRDGLATLPGEERASLLARAADAAAHRADLLGSGPVELGAAIDWHRDVKSGRRWPLVHHTRIRLLAGDGSDVKVPWELSRGHHLPLLAAAHRLTGDDAYLNELGAQLRHWIAENPVELGVNWACTMDVGIRAANWVAALAVAGASAAAAPWCGEVLASLLEHGRFIRAHPEHTPVRGNHFLADVAGLLVVAAVFRGAEGRAWARWGREQLIAEMEHQVHEDGCSHEASLAYHRLVCELFARGAEAAEALTGPLPAAFIERLARMHDVVAAVQRPDGLTPQVGDHDDGRFLPLGGHGRLDPRDHRHLLADAGRATGPAEGSVLLPGGGYAVLRRGPLFVLARCGETGMQGLGGHGHNDQLEVEVCHGADVLVTDPGAYVYTPDPAARNAFRSTAAHATLQVDGREQNPLDRGLFLMPDHTRAEVVGFDAEEPSFTGRHHGFAPVVHERTVRLTDGGVSIEDVVTDGAPHELTWSFPLAPGASAAGRDGGVEITAGATRALLVADCVEWSVRGGHVSPRYGVRAAAEVVGARARSAPGRHAVRFELRLS